MMRQGEKVGWWMVARLDTWMIVVSSKHPLRWRKETPEWFLPISPHFLPMTPHLIVCVVAKLSKRGCFPSCHSNMMHLSVATVTRGAFLYSGQVIPPALLSPCFNFFFIAFLPGTRQLLLVPQAKWDGRDKGACALSELSLCNQLREADSAMRSRERRLFPAKGAGLLKQPFSLWRQLGKAHILNQYSRHCWKNFPIALQLRPELSHAHNTRRPLHEAACPSLPFCLCLSFLFGCLEGDGEEWGGSFS